MAYAPMSSGGKKKDPLKAVVAGGISGAIEACVSYPTDFVKTQMQLFEEKGKLGPIQCARETIKANGTLGLYRGLSSLLYFAAPKTAIRFTGFETLRNMLADDKGKMGDMRTLLAGMGAGAAEAIFAVTPMDTIKTKLIHDQLTRAPHERRYHGFAHGVRTIIKEQGFGGVYRGLTATILKQGSNQAIRWLVFSRVKESLARYKGLSSPDELQVRHTIFASLCASVASVYGNTPMDVIKTRMQGLEAHKYKSVGACAKMIWQNEGFTAFYKGATARLARVTLDVTVVMVLYEQMIKMLDKVWKTD